MRDWKVQFEVLNRPKNVNPVQMTASYLRSKWDRSALDRPVLFFGVSRTVPANERKELRKCASGKFSVPQEQIAKFENSVLKAVARILGKGIEEFRTIDIDESAKHKFLSGATNEGTKYSEFHFGAGESSIIKMVSEIESAPDYTLVLIEEIENGLHPIATQKLVEYLIDVAERKKVQVVFTTHSNDALLPLPDKAIWAVSDAGLVQGKLDIESLRALTGIVEKDAALFVEDKFAQKWVEAILRHNSLDLLQIVEIHPMQGDGIAAKTAKAHNENPAISTKAVCILDGDSQLEESPADQIIKLPGLAPDIHVFGTCLDEWDTIGARLTLALQQPVESQDRVKQVLEAVQLETMDHHLYFDKVAEKLGFLPTGTVVQAFVNTWSQHFKPQSTEFTDTIRWCLDAYGVNA